MGSIRIERSHQLGQTQVRALSEQVIERLEQNNRFDWQWVDECLQFNYLGAKGALHPLADRLVINVKLTLLQRPFAGQIRNTIEQQLDDLLG